MGNLAAHAFMWSRCHEHHRKTPFPDPGRYGHARHRNRHLDDFVAGFTRALRYVSHASLREHDLHQPALDTRADPSRSHALISIEQAPPMTTLGRWRPRRRPNRADRQAESSM